MNKTLVLSQLGHTWIIDLDGTVVKHNGYKIDGCDSWLPGAREFLESIPTNDMVVFLTSRKSEYADVTEGFLKNNGVRWDHIIYDAPYGERILLNDDKPTGLITGYSVNLARNVGPDIGIEVDPLI